MIRKYLKKEKNCLNYRMPARSGKFSSLLDFWKKIERTADNDLFSNDKDCLRKICKLLQVGYK